MSIQKKRDCGACAEVCPTHAVYTISENNLHKPELKPESCIGCGACQHVCPVTPKAIFVTGLPLHETAEPPFFKSSEKQAVQSSTSGFPF